MFTLSRRFALTQIGVAKCKKTFLYSDGLFPWFCCLTDASLKDKILTRGSALTFNFRTYFLLGNSCLRTQTGRWLPEHGTSLLEVVSLLGQIFGTRFPLGLGPLPPHHPHPPTPPPDRGRRQRSLVCWRPTKTNRWWWTGLVDLNFSPIVLQGDASTCLRVNLRRAIRADGHTTQINLKNTV